MIPADSTVAVSRVFAGAAAAPVSLDRLARLFAEALPGCAAATAARWKDGRVLEVTATGDDVAALLASQLEQGAGPAVEGVEAGFAWCPDTRDERRWPRFRQDALRLGVRGLVTLARRDGAETVTVTSYGVRPGLPALDTAALAWLFASGAAGPGLSPASPSAGSSSRVAVALLMRALGTSEEKARTLLRAIARSRRCASEDAARWLVAEHTRVEGRPRGSDTVPRPRPAAPAETA